MDNFNPPFSAHEIQLRNGYYNPVGVYADSYTLRYYERNLMQRILYFIEKDGMPEEWNWPYIWFSLVKHGYCGIFDAVGKEKQHYGVIPQYGTLSGIGLFCQPTRLSVVNRFINAPLLKIGEECELLQLTPDYMGIWDIIEFYAVKMALAAKVADMNLVTSRTSHIVGAKTKQAAAALKMAEDKAQSGMPLVVIDDKMVIPDDPNSAKSPFQVLDYDVKNQFIVPDVLNVMHTLLKDFDTEIGIPNANTEKRERMIEAEVNQNNAETYSRIQTFIDCLQASAKRINKMYGLNLSFRMRGVYNASNSYIAESSET